MKAVILAAGEGVRLQPITLTRPRLKATGKPMASRRIRPAKRIKAIMYQSKALTPFLQKRIYYYRCPERALLYTESGEGDSLWACSDKRGRDKPLRVMTKTNSIHMHPT